jgi:hypothetical protein
MTIKSSGIRLHIEPLQFDALLQSLEAKTPPKTQMDFSVKQVVVRLYDFITRSLASHYSFDELAVIIQGSLSELEILDDEMEIKGATLRQYFLDEKRERERADGGTGGPGGRKAAGGRSVKTPIRGHGKAEVAAVEAVVEAVVLEPEKAIGEKAKRAPTARTSAVELAY